MAVRRVDILNCEQFVYTPYIYPTQMMIACLKRRGSRSHVKVTICRLVNIVKYQSHTDLQVDPNPHTGTVEMRKVPLDEKA